MKDANKRSHENHRMHILSHSFQILWYIDVNSLGPGDANMLHQITSLFWHQIRIPREISFQMNGNITMVRSILPTIASKASSSSWAAGAFLAISTVSRHHWECWDSQGANQLINCVVAAKKWKSYCAIRNLCFACKILHLVIFRFRVEVN